MVSISRFILFAMGSLCVAACSPIVDVRGHSTDIEDFKQIIPKQSTADDVRAVLGSPSATSTFGRETWYYITERKERMGPFPTEVVDQNVVAVHFNAAHVVADIATYDKDEAKNVTAVSKTTPAEGNELTIMKQLFGNFGRFATPGRAIDPKNLGQ